MDRRRIVRFAPVALALAVLAAGPAGANAGSSRMVMPDGSVRYDYGRHPAPELRCRPHFVCDITLDGGESVLNLALGDSAHWVIASGQSGTGGSTPHLFVKPTQAALDTNLVITTTKRTYTILLHSDDRSSAQHLEFRYLDEEAAARAASDARERAAVAGVLAGTPQVAVDAADAKYQILGDPSLAPQRVFNDGARTFIVYKTLPSDLPWVARFEKDGTSHELDFRIVGTTLIVDSVESNIDLIVGHGRGERRASIRHA